MSRGGFHGGGFHSGGHHGGFGGFHGGGYHGGFHSGGHYYGGGYRGNNESDELFAYRFYSSLIVLGIGLFGFLVTSCYNGNAPGFDYFSIGLFFISCFFYASTFNESGRTAALKGLRKGGCSGAVWKGESPYFRVGNYQTWFDTRATQYCISFYEKNFGYENAKKVRETMDRTPKIIWMNQKLWAAGGIICFVSSFFFYELVIPFFENRIMTDEAFNFVDNAVFYMPSVLALLFSLTGFILVKVRDNLLYKCASRIVHDNIAAEERMKTESIIASKLSKKWYYNRCPNCGAEASKALRNCTHCGASLEVMSFEDGISGAIHRISGAAEEGNQ